MFPSSAGCALIARLTPPTLAALAALSLGFFSGSAFAEPNYAASMHGDLKYGPEFAHFEYANPDAPKGGAVRLPAIGTFDSFNPFVLKGLAAAGISGIYDTLMEQAQDEPFSEYGLLAESIDIAEDKSRVTFVLRENARWHDGEPVTAEDVVFSFEQLLEKGHPFYRSYYNGIDIVEALDERTVRFIFKEAGNGELPLIVGQLQILPKHWYADHEYTSTDLVPPLGSGPYKVERFEAGRSVTYSRVEDYWGENLPVNKGRYNFDTLTFDYYRDATIAHEAFKSGELDWKSENIAKNWATGYDFPAARAGRVIQELIDDGSSQPMQAFVFNLRQARFADPRVRRALGYAFDFEWANKNLFFDAYKRTSSYFQNTEMAATDLPEGDELALLDTYRDQLPDSVFSEVFALPVSDGSGNNRRQLREAIRLLKQAGWEIRNGKLTQVESGEVMAFELLLGSPTTERLGLAFAKSLEKLGVDMRVRVVDSAQYQERMDNRDFDMLVSGWRQSASPGNEQLDYWGSASANEPGSRNYAGISHPVIDDLIQKIINADSRAALVTAAKALDRVLLHNHYVIPQYHGPFHRVAYWNKFGHPKTPPVHAIGFDTWWIDADKAAKLKQ